MKEKIFILNGVDAHYNEKHGQNSFFNIENLSKIGQIIKLSNPEIGFTSNKLASLFKNHLKDNPTSINLIIDMHGIVLKGNHFMHTGKAGFITNFLFNILGLEQFKDIVLESSQTVIEQLVKATKNIPLTVLTNGCYGGHLPSLVIKMPKGSKIISLSNKKSLTLSYDYSNNNIDKLLNYFAQYELKFENIVELYALSQKVSGNTPITGVHGKDGKAYQLKLNHLAEKFILNDKKFSPLFEKLFEDNIIDRNHVLSLINKVKNNSLKIKELKVPKAFLSDVKECILAGESLENFKSKFEEKYYYPGALKSFLIEDQFAIKSLLKAINEKNT